MMWKHISALCAEIQCGFILRSPISQLTCANISVFTHVGKDFYNGK